MARIQIYDTTLRDGSQGEGVNFSLEDKLAITAKLDELGFDFIEGGYPLSNPKDAEYFQRAADLPLKHAKVAAFGMTRRKGIAAEDDIGMQALRDAETEVVTIVGKTWDLHVREVLGVERGREPGDDPRFGRLPAGGRPRSDLRRRTFFRRLRTAIPISPCGPSGPPRRQGPRSSSCATPTAAACRSGSPRVSTRPARHSPFPSASTAITIATWRRPIRWRPCGTAPSRCRGPSTASASGAATST